MCPTSLAPEIEKAVENGRLLEDLIKEAGIRYLKARKRKGCEDGREGVAAALRQRLSIVLSGNSCSVPDDISSGPEDFSDDTRALIGRIRSSAPFASGWRRPVNVSGRYPSRKMGVTIQFESHRVELPFVHEMEHDRGRSRVLRSASRHSVGIPERQAEDV